MNNSQEMLEDVRATIADLLEGQQNFVDQLDKKRYYALLTELFLAERGIIKAIALNK